jgi:hypothetical protein
VTAGAIPAASYPQPILEAPSRERRRAAQRERLRKARRRRLGVFLAGLAIAVAAVLNMRAQDDYPEPADGKLHGFVEDVSERWRAHQAKKDGRYLDPINGIAASGYGSGMIGYAQLTSPDEDAQSQGFRAIRFALSEPPDERGVFDQLVLARAYNWAREHLSDHEDFEELEDEWRGNLERTADIFFFRPGAWVECFKDDNCYSNHEMVEAAADAELLATGLEGKGDKAKLRDRDALRKRTERLIGPLADRAAGTAAYTRERRGLGLLSDTGPYPLGYHVLSTALLAMTIDTLGDDAPGQARKVLERALETMAGYIGPDGDLAYVGARHEQVWVLAAAMYAGRAGAKILGPDSDAGRRAEATGQRAYERLRRVHPLEATGLRVGTRPLNDTYRGIDGALIPSNGLSLLFLREASRIEPVEPAESIPPDRDGHTFVDPVHARIATGRNGDVWWAVRARPRLPVDPKRGPDQRFDAGVVGLKARVGGEWRDLIEPRPRTTAVQIRSSGPTMIAPNGEIGYLWGDRIVPRPGGVDVVGGFRARSRVHVDQPAEWLRQGVTFRYRVVDGGLTLSWDAQAGDRYGVIVWAKEGEYTPRPDGLVTGAGRHVFSARPPQWTVGSIQGSCCALDVRGVAGTITAPGPGPLTWRIEPAS